MKLPELKILLVRNNIKGGTYLNKAELVKLLIANNVIIEGNETHQPVMGKCKISEEDVQHQILTDKERMEEVERRKRLQKERREKYQREYREKYWKEYRKERSRTNNDSDPAVRSTHIRNNPRKVEILDRTTGNVTTYPSMYKAGKELMQDPQLIAWYNGKVWRNRYDIKVY